MLNFEWDENKNKANKEKHKISFETAQYVFLDPNAKHKFSRDVCSEKRMQIVGKILNVVIVLVVYTERNDNIRIISARPASKKERIFYNEYR